MTRPPRQASPARGARMTVALAMASHPLPTVAVTAFTTALAVAAGRQAGGAVLVAATVLAGQLSVGWSNDALDIQRDAGAGRRDKPAARGEVSPSALWRAAGIAVLAAVPLSFANGTRAGAAHLIGMSAAWAYNLGIKSTPLSIVPFGVAFGLLPVFVWGGLAGAPWPPWWLALAAGLLGMGAHLANVLPDLDADVAGGVRGLAHRVRPRAARGVMAGLFVLAVLVVALGPPGPVSGPAWIGVAVAVALAAIAYRRARPGDQVGFRLGLMIALVGLALIAVEVGGTR